MLHPIRRIRLTSQYRSSHELDDTNVGLTPSSLKIALYTVIEWDVDTSSCSIFLVITLIILKASSRPCDYYLFAKPHFFEALQGPRRKLSGCIYPRGIGNAF